MPEINLDAPRNAGFEKGKRAYLHSSNRRVRRLLLRRIVDDSLNESPVANSARILFEGKGLEELVIGESSDVDVIALLGKPKETSRVAGHRNLYYEDVTFNIDGNFKLNAILTEPGFAGKTKLGIQHGSGLDEIKKAYGKPNYVLWGGRFLGFRDHGVAFHLDAQQKVGKIVINIIE